MPWSSTDAGASVLREDTASAGALLQGARVVLAAGGGAGSARESLRRLALKAVRAHFTRNSAQFREADAEGLPAAVCALIEGSDTEEAENCEEALVAMATAGEGELLADLLGDSSPLVALAMGGAAGSTARVRALSAAVACGEVSARGGEALRSSSALGVIKASVGACGDLLERLNGVELLARIADGAAAEACGADVAEALLPLIEGSAGAEAGDMVLSPIVATAACRAARAAPPAAGERLVRAVVALAHGAAEGGDPSLEASARDALSHAPVELVFACEDAAKELCSAALGVLARRPLEEPRLAAAHALATLAGATDSAAAAEAEVLSDATETALKAAFEGAVGELPTPGVGPALWWLINQAPAGGDGAAQRAGAYRLVRALARRQWGARACFSSSQLLEALGSRAHDASGAAAAERVHAADALRHAGAAAGATDEALIALGPPGGRIERPVAIPEVATATR